MVVLRTPWLTTLSDFCCHRFLSDQVDHSLSFVDDDSEMLVDGVDEWAAPCGVSVD